MPNHPYEKSVAPGRGQPLMLHFRTPAGFVLLIAAMLVLAFNRRFWLEAGLASWHGNLGDILFLAALAVLLLLVHASALLLIPGRLPLMVVAGLLFPVAAMAAFCADNFGVVFDEEMIRNLGQTNRRETMGLLTPRLFVYVFGLGVLPVFLVARSRIAPMGWRAQLQHRTMFIVACVLLAAVIALPFAQRLRTLLERQQLHYLSVPGAAVAAAGAYLRTELHAATSSAPLLADGPMQRLAVPPGARPLLVFLVVGETARHMNFQLGGYDRETNPDLSRIDNLHYFSNAWACASSTAVSVPCMLSHFGRNRFSAAAYRRASNVLDQLAGTGIAVEWRSNNTYNFDPGTRIAKTDLSKSMHPALCNEESCLDEIMLEGLEQSLEHGTGDRLIAFHQMGSHGPAYFLRYPSWQEAFRPACRNKDVVACSSEELRNAYDNTIRYTDSVLAALIGALGRFSDRYDTALLYVSDHGESLGENGIFLHSAPFHNAPDEQKRIPFMLWLSEGYGKRFGIDAACLRGRKEAAISHDNVYHTLLGMMAARNAHYDSALDVLSACAGMRTPAR